jgi:hypothetical protein
MGQKGSFLLRSLGAYRGRNKNPAVFHKLNSEFGITGKLGVTGLLSAVFDFQIGKQECKNQKNYVSFEPLDLFWSIIYTIFTQILRALATCLSILRRRNVNFHFDSPLLRIFALSRIQ